MLSKSLKAKLTLVSTDGGKSWLCVRQHYLCDLQTHHLFDESYQSGIFITEAIPAKQEKEYDDEDFHPRKNSRC